MAKQLSLVEGGADEPNLFSYATLDRDTEVAARADAELIKLRLRNTAENVIEIGLALIRQKGRLPHGAFLPWLSAEFAMSDRSAQKFMAVAERYGNKYERCADLTPQALYELAAPSTSEEVREEVERRVAAGELVSAAAVRSLKADARKAAEAAAEQTASAEKHAEIYRQEVDSLRVKLAKAKEKQPSPPPAAPPHASVAPAPPEQSNVVSLGGRRPAVAPEACSIGGDGDDGDGDFNLADATHRAEAFSGALSTLDFIDVTPADFRALLARESADMRELYRVKLTNAATKIDAILKGL